jgi:hypothetical protein
MVRKRKSAAQRLLEGRAPGRDSGGRPVLPPASPRNDRNEVTPPSMPRAWPLSPDEKKVWRRILRRLQSSPTQERFAAYCRAVVAQQQVSADLAAGAAVPEGTQARLAKEIREFEDGYLTAPEPISVSNSVALDLLAGANGGGRNPFADAPDFAGRRRKTPWQVAPNPVFPTPGRLRSLKLSGENPCPPEDPAHHWAWEQAMRESDKNDRIVRPPGFYRREYHYDANNNLWDEYETEPDKPDDDA